MAPGDRWFFDRVAGVYDLVTPRMPAEPIRAGLALADGPVRRVLDVGGGTGRATRNLPGTDLVVVDISGRMLRRAPAGRDRVQASGTHLPMDDGTTDAVIIADALHHMPDHDRVLAEAHRVLRPGGVLVIREFDRGTVRGRLLQAAEHAIRMESKFLTAGELQEHLTAAGFRASVLDDGFMVTVTGRKPGGP